MSDPILVTEVISTVRRAGKVPAHVMIGSESRLVDDLAIDSLDLVDVILKLQDQFDVVIEDDDLPNLLKVSDLVNYITARQGKAVA